MEREIDTRSYSQEEIVGLGTLDTLASLKDAADDMEIEMKEGQEIHFEKAKTGETIDYDETVKAVWRGYRIGLLRQAYDEGWGNAAMDVLRFNVEEEIWKQDEE